MTQEAWAREVFLSLDRVRSLEYRPSESPGWDSAYRMAQLGQFLRVDGPAGPMALVPLHLVVHPEAQQLVVLDPAVEGQTALFGTPVLVHTTLPTVSPTEEKPGPRQLLLGGFASEV